MAGTISQSPEIKSFDRAKLELLLKNYLLGVYLIIYLSETENQIPGFRIDEHIVIHRDTLSIEKRPAFLIFIRITC